ncbi:MAG: pyridoxamine 5'-phosphate oxidase family protein [Pseudomonadota bacterium]
MSEFEQTERTRLRLYHELGVFDKEAIYAIIDEMPMCHVSVVIDDYPYIQPTIHWRDGDKVFVHGAVKNKMVNAIRKGAKACLSFAHFEGFILPRSGFNHAVLYRSATLFSAGRFVEDTQEKELRLKQFIEHIQPGRWDTIRQPSENELAQTGIIEFAIKEVSGKSIPAELVPGLMPGGELEDPADADYHPWTGTLPYTLVAGEPVEYPGT